LKALLVTPVVAPRSSAVVRWLVVIAGVNIAVCQTLTPFASQDLLTPAPQEDATKHAPLPCLKPARLPGINDYDGPLKKTVGILAPALERQSVHPPRYKPGVRLCSLNLHDKFLLFVKDSTGPINSIGTAFSAGIDHSSNRDPTFGLGSAGYAKRYGATLADSVSAKFFRDLAYPAIFHEDPRYYRLGRGSAGKRLFNAAEHLFVAHHEDGTRMFNYSEWLGSASSAALGNLYHPGNEHGTGDTARRIGYGFAFDIGYDVLREFWPEISRKLKLPFRVEPVPSNPDIGRNDH
jgi:hypothetical protein